MQSCTKTVPDAGADGHRPVFLADGKLYAILHNAQHALLDFKGFSLTQMYVPISGQYVL